MVKKSQNLKVLHIITSMNTGGAEAMALKLLKALKPSVNSCVVVLMERGTLSEQLDALNIPSHYLGIKKGKLPSLGAVKNLCRYAKEFRPDVVQGWMYHGNIAASLTKIVLNPQPALIWNIRQTLNEKKPEKGLTGFLIKISARLSKMPTQIVYNSSLSAIQHEIIGYRKNASVVVPNGFDLQLFKPNFQKRREVRSELGISPAVKLIGHVARHHPMKDHINFLSAAKKVSDKQDDVCFVLAGHKLDSGNKEIMEFIRELKLEEHIILLGECADTARIMSSFDVFVSSSAWGEGFPNVVGEAMASGVPCVVTDVGASSYVVGEFGIVVPPANSVALADAVLEMLAHSPEAYAHKAEEGRKRMAAQFSIEQVAASYFTLYRNAVIS